MNQLVENSTELLKKLIATPSFSEKENKSAQILQDFFEDQNIPIERHKNNIWATNKYFDTNKPTILLNSHHDTVKPNSGYSRDPFTPVIEDGKLFGLGSNDAGGPLTSLIATFIHFYEQKDLTYNLIFAASAEEEISGDGGLVSILNKIPKIDCAIIGEPTQMHMAVAEKGLMVLDCTAKGVSGHVAHNEGENAIFKAMKDIEWFRNYEFPEESQTLGPVKMTVSKIKAGEKHNMVPDTCGYTVDVRSTDIYTNQDILKLIRKHVYSSIHPRSTRLNSSSIPLDHPIVESGTALGLEQYGSPTLSDQALLSVPSLKIGPGNSARSHTADEFIRLDEIEKGIEIYIQLLDSAITNNQSTDNK
ncbi:acetylornithine deacetylase [Aliifodinibius salipaludis]|uniref:Acetylornithine deacetylase n=1 Tax=Fodinibius salipaludis TaxID=2032627 RepID=A0A2A2G9W2_9BACT|nr:M20 family metallo-hydrolase [Aliifodinibius salipaludis]PAU93602.1 acetylornithine deacetylase [Aliifodinibius salipaludis]